MNNYTCEHLRTTSPIAIDISMSLSTTQYTADDIANSRAVWRELRSNLWRNGSYGCYSVKISRRWNDEDHSWSKSLWCGIDNTVLLPISRDIYYSVNSSSRIPPTNSRGKVVDIRNIAPQRAYIQCVNALYAEFDATHFAGGMDECEAAVYERVGAFASVIIRSGGGFHVYTLLKKTFVIDGDADALARADLLQKSWVAHVQSDNGAKNLNRVLRVPGTFNYKRGEPRLVQAIYANFDNRHSIDDLADAMRESINALVSKRLSSNNDREVISVDRLTRSDARRISKYIVAAITGYVNDIAACGSPQGGRHTGRHPVILSCAQRVGGMVAAGVVNETYACELLVQAAMGVGKTESEARHVIESGIEWGRANVKWAAPESKSNGMVRNVSR